MFPLNSEQGYGGPTLSHIALQNALRFLISSFTKQPPWRFGYCRKADGASKSHWKESACGPHHAPIAVGAEKKEVGEIP